MLEWFAGIFRSNEEKQKLSKKIEKSA